MKKKVILITGTIFIISIIIFFVYRIVQVGSFLNVSNKHTIIGVKLDNEQYSDYLNVIEEYFEPLDHSNTEDFLKRVNYFVYNFCITGSDITSKVADIFSEPYTACGGCSFIFRAIAEYYGIQTRYSHLYNIPNQGNHSIVEAYYNDEWHMFDPTFGTFFSRDGSIEGNVLSLREINYDLHDKTLKDFVFKAISKNENLKDSMNNVLFNLYEPGMFNEPYMKIDYYRTAERYGQDDSNLQTFLKIPIDMSQDIFELGTDFNDVNEGEKNYLNISNKYLLDESRDNDFSFLSSYIGTNAVIQYTVLNFSNLKVNSKYHLVLIGFSDQDSKLQMIFFDNGGRIKEEQPVQIYKGKYKFEIEFLAMKPNANLILSLYENKSNERIRLFYIFIEREK